MGGEEEGVLEDDYEVQDEVHSGRKISERKDFVKKKNHMGV